MSGAAMLRSLLLLLSLPALLACGRSPQQLADGPDPLAALGSPAASHRYTVPFWAKEAHGKSTLWESAKRFCTGRDEAAYPNCHAVRVVTFWETPPPFPRLPVRSVGDLLGEAAAASPVSPAPPTSPAPPSPVRGQKGGRP